MAAGRPSSYDPEYHPKHAAKLCELGATDEELGSFFEVSTRTIDRWKNQHEEFCRSVKIGKDFADNRVERSLYQKATGFYYTEEQAFKVKESSTKERVEVVEVEKFAASEVSAQIFWLKNRKKAEWRDKVDHEHTGKDGKDLQFELKPSEKLAQFLDSNAAKSG